jgi:quinol-cytochrome oxidoreductase complex cytochrome b subunit
MKDQISSPASTSTTNNVNLLGSYAAILTAAFLFLAPVFSGPNRLERAIRWIFIISFVLTMIALIVLSVQYGIHREYRFEVAAITINWIVLIISGILLSRVFRRGMRISS